MNRRRIKKAVLKYILGIKINQSEVKAIVSISRDLKECSWKRIKLGEAKESTAARFIPPFYLPCWLKT